MKRLILGIGLFLGGIMGWSGWIIANMVLFAGGVSSVSSGLRGSATTVATLFILIAVAGLVLAVYEAFNKKESK